MRFRLVWYVTNNDNKYHADDRFEYLGDRDGICRLWYELIRQGNRHVEIWTLDGTRQTPELGLNTIWSGYRV